MTDALIGHSGFVGGTLLAQRDFEALYRSHDLESSAGRRFELVVCAAAPAQKWIANREPSADRQNIERLIARLDAIECNTFVLISTVDVYQRAVAVDEDTPVDEEGLHPYGLHRRLLEKFVEKRFQNRLIVRLPGLVGPRLRKNVIYDFLNENNLSAVDSRSVFQFYPMVNLWHDLQLALKAKLGLLHLTAEPISVGELAASGFGISFDRTLEGTPANYDFRSKHASSFSGQGAYQYSKRETLLAIRAYAQSEPRAAARVKAVAP